MISKIIEKKEKGLILSREEIETAVMGFVNGEISKKEMTKFIKAVYEKGMNDKETYYLTDVMTHSGDVLNFKNEEGVFVDKHSTGGVSDSTTIILLPLIALSGLKFLKMSGRKLGHTGGTIDKVEQFEGFKTDITLEEAKEIVKRIGACELSQTLDLAPADKVIYKLRDETGYIESLPLISSSIMSKKLACGTDIIVLDVKCGNGAFMKTEEDAIKLANSMFEIGSLANKKVVAVVSDMNQPLGQNIGSLMETIEAIEVLEGKKGRLLDISKILAKYIISKGANISLNDAEKQVDEYIKSGKAIEKLKEIVVAQGGSLNLFDKNYRANIYSKNYNIKSNVSGYLNSINCEKLGFMVRDYCQNGGFGMKVHVNLGDYVNNGDIIATFYGDPMEVNVSEIFTIEEKKDNQQIKLVYKIVE